MVVNVDIDGILLDNYLRSGQMGFTDYTRRFTTAQLILRDKPEALAKLCALQKELESKWNRDLPTLQLALYSSNNLKHYMRPVVNNVKITVELWKVKQELERFMFATDRIIIDNCGVKWGGRI